MAQDERRIKVVLRLIEELWRKTPDLRFCQLIDNITCEIPDIYHIEDEEFSKMVLEYDKQINAIIKK